MIYVPFDIGIKVLDLYDEIGHLFLYDIEGIQVLCRPLLISEIEAVIKLANQLPDYIVEDWICKKVIVHSTSDLFTKAGYYFFISKDILKRSSVADQKELEKEISAKRSIIVNKVDSQVENLICSAFKGLRPVDIRNMTQTKCLDLLVRSESLLNVKLSSESEKPRRRQGFSSIGDPEAEAQRILSKEIADIPEFVKDNAAIRDH